MQPTRARSCPSGLLVGIVALLAAGLVPGCRWMNRSGDLRATRTGDVSTPLAAGRAGQSVEMRCGVGGLTAAGRDKIRRAPYLQKVGPERATILFTTASVRKTVVDVTTPEGAPVAMIPARHDAAARPRGARQLVAEVAGLEAGQVYCYRLREEGGDVLTAQGGFQTAPATGSLAPVRFIAFGDSGEGSPDQLALLAKMRKVPFDFIVHVGDIAYERGTRQQFEEKFFRIYAELLRTFPVFPTSGNHDYKTADGGIYREVFALPENGGPGGVERWYSFDWGDVHFVALDTEKIGPAQARWLDRDLARNRLPWVVVYAHKPPYSSGSHGSDGRVRRWFVPIFEKHKVPLVLVGHEHNYERTKPLGGVTYIVTGGGGKGTRWVGSSDFTAFAEPVVHFVYVTVEGDALTLHAIDATGREFDSMVIRRPEEVARYRARLDAEAQARAAAATPASSPAGAAAPVVAPRVGVGSSGALGGAHLRGPAAP